LKSTHQTFELLQKTSDLHPQSANSTTKWCLIATESWSIRQETKYEAVVGEISG